MFILCLSVFHRLKLVTESLICWDRNWIRLVLFISASLLPLSSCCLLFVHRVSMETGVVLLFCFVAGRRFWTLFSSCKTRRSKPGFVVGQEPEPLQVLYSCLCRAGEDPLPAPADPGSAPGGGPSPGEVCSQKPG